VSNAPESPPGGDARPASTLPIRAARAEDVDAYVQHVVEHVAESGQGGAPHFAMSRRVKRDEVRESALVRWTRRLDEPLWGRAWLLWDAARSAGSTAAPTAADEHTRRARVVGHIELRGGRIATEMHRAVAGMGILRSHTGQGHGGRLIAAAVEWAKAVAKLEYVDLGVFSNNEPARKLYRRAGFVEIGVRSDAFRIDDGVRVDDVLMVLDIR
jgi:RimJ/RimL family protein N-acetyltransferase